MAVARKNTTSNSGSYTTSIAISSGWTATSGNLLLLSIQVYGTGTITATTPTGWTLVRSGTATNTARNFGALFYRVATGTSADTLTSVTISGGASGRYTIEEWTGLASKSPLDTALATVNTYTTANTGAAMTVGTPTATTANSWTYALTTQRLSAAPTAFTYTWTSGYTADVAPTATTQNNHGTAYKQNTATGSQTALTNTFASTGANNTAAVSLWATFKTTGTPTAAYTYSLSTLTLSVDGSTSASTTTNIVSYAWNWGDSSSTAASSSATSSHTYAAEGTYTVVLTITDDKGQTSTSSQSIAVTIPNLTGWINVGGSNLYPGYLFYWDQSVKRKLGPYKDDRKGPFVITAVDSFPQANNAPWDPTKWTTVNGAGTVNVQNGKGYLTLPSGNYINGARAFYSGSPIVADMEVYAEMTLPALNEVYPSITLRTTSSDVYTSGAGNGSAKNGYIIIWEPSGNEVEIQAGYTAGTTLDSFAYTFTSTAQKFRVRVEKSQLSIKIWPAASAEPTAWNYSQPVAFDQSAGSCMFSTATGNNTVGTTYFDNIAIYTPNYFLDGQQPAPQGNVTNFRQVFVEDFNTTAASGALNSNTSQFATTYANSWQPYTDGTGNEYYSSSQVSAHDGVMDVYMDGSHGAAGTFGPSSTAYSHVGGRFSVRARTLDAIGNGAAFMLWPSSENWDDGEVDYPESNFEVSPYVHQHIMNGGGNDTAENLTYNTGVSWRDWHIYTIEWISGTSLKYYLDGVLVASSTTQIPTTAHRHMFQVGNYGNPGHLYIDWVAHYDYDNTIP